MDSPGRHAPQNFTMLHFVAYFNITSLTRQQLKRLFPHLLIPDSHGRWPLSWAADRGNVDVANLLIKCGFSVEAKEVYADFELGRALVRAIESDSEDIVKLLLENGAEAHYYHVLPFEGLENEQERRSLGGDELKSLQHLDKLMRIAPTDSEVVLYVFLCLCILVQLLYRLFS